MNQYKTLGAPDATMNTYSAYGLTIQSQFDLPELRSAEASSDVDALFRQGEVKPVPKWVNGEGGRRIQADPAQCRLSYESYGSFLVEDGKRVTFDPNPAGVTTTKIVRRLLENEILGVLLHQRGRLMLHASAVVVDGNAIVFLGPRGVGKSTTAAAFHAHGYGIIEDDIVSVRIENETPMVHPGVPELRLNPDTVEVLGFTETTSYPNDGNSGKRYHRLDDMPSAAPILACYVLQPSQTYSVTPLPEREQLFSLVESTYTQGLLSDTAQTGNHFQQCRTVVARTKFRSLSRRDDLDDISALVGTVIEDAKL